MNETLSVIDEHITDMRTPTSAHSAGEHPRPRGPRPNPYEAEYRLSYINGQETDEEESQQLSTAEVSKWPPSRVAEYLEDAGVDKQHCDVFRDQEISGEVLLTMEQSAIFIKEFELGSVGRRLKTWNKIKAFQDEVKHAEAPSMHRSNSDYSANGDDVLNVHDGGTRSASAAQLPSHYLSPQDYASELRQRQQGSERKLSVPVLSAAPQGRSMIDHEARQSQHVRPESIIRPSAASVRRMNHARRTSSIDSKASMPDMQSPPTGHSRKVSLDRLWSMGIGHERRLSKSAQAGAHARTTSAGSAHLSPSGNYDRSPGLGPSPEGDEPGYESTLDNKRTRQRFFSRRLVSSVPHSRVPSANEQDHEHAVAGADLLSPTPPSSSGPSSAHTSLPPTSVGATPLAMRGASQPKILPGKTTLDGLGSPIVTKLEYGQSSPVPQSSETSSTAQSPSGTHGFSIFKSSRSTGLRSASDAATYDRKQAPHATNISSPLQSPVRTGSTTPSTETQSFEQPKSDDRNSTASSNNAAAPSLADPSASKTRPARNKRFTSAYTRGLEKKPPLEQMAGCDYSGWMKKRSANIMGSWKSRLFVLRGRRLSYYYSENDIEEKGLIDISGHRVLPADDEKLTGLHAQFTGGKSPAATEPSPKITTAAAVDLATKSAGDDKDEGTFIFKLVPPREGMSKAVNFTKPAVHYFAVGSRKEGRLWMAALMRATIDYDASGAVTTSYNQETISLAKARARRERPPALRNISGASGSEDTKSVRVSPHPPRLDNASGLGIGGLLNGARESVSTSTGADDSSDHKESIEVEHRSFDFDDLGGSTRNVAPTPR